VKKVIANAHSGWKGTLQEISVKTVKKMGKIGIYPIFPIEFLFFL